MSKPLLAVFSQDSAFYTDLIDSLKDCYRFGICDSVEEVQSFCRSHQPIGFVFDTGFSLRPDFANNFLLQLRESYPNSLIAVWCREDVDFPCFSIAEKTIFPVAVREGVDKLAALLLEHIPVDENPHPLCNDERQESGVEESQYLHDKSSDSIVLEGKSRRLKTEMPKLSSMLRELEIASAHDVTILLVGETGSGKTYLSRLIHEISPRNDEPFLTVACGALPADLIESEFFGHVRGSFTGAFADKKGKFLAAGTGTILLDEIDVLGPEQQVKLLRVIESGEFEPVGSNQTMKSKARLVVASNVELEPLVEQGSFRSDLFYRLSMLKFQLPPLRERQNDIIPLSKKFIRDFSKKHGVKVSEVRPEFFDLLLKYQWPGNIRELENLMQRAVIYCRDGILSPQHLPDFCRIPRERIFSTVCESIPKMSGTFRNESFEKSLVSQVALTERDIIEKALQNHNFSRTKTAKHLGISRVTLYNKMKKYGIAVA